MIPIHLNPQHVKLGLVGNDALAVRRYDWFADLGYTPVVWSPAPSQDLMAKVGSALQIGVPDHAALTPLGAIWIADLPVEQAHALAKDARACGILVNVEDDMAFCDFHTPALVRRGPIVISIGTGGASPAVASFVKRVIKAAIPETWEAIVAHLSGLRLSLRQGGTKPREIIEIAQTYLTDPNISSQIAPCGKATCLLLPNVRSQTGDQ
jgi:precorrin-2 dehydrogenase / sirohydrochlorin ferrochelatase